MIPHARRWTSAVAPLTCLGLIPLMTGCPGGGGGMTGLPGSSILSSFTTTDAVVGGTGKFRITLVDPVQKDTTIALSSGSTDILTVPATAKVVSGSDTAEVAYNGVAAGSATVTATLDGSVLSTVLDVVPSVQLSGFSASGLMQTGAAGIVYVSLNMVTPTDVTVNLSSSNAAIVAVPSTVTIHAFESSVDVPFKAGPVGSAVVTATLDGGSRSTTVTTVSAPSLNAVYAPTRVQVGSNVAFSLYLDAVPAADTVVALTSSNASAVSIPASFTIPAGFTSATFQGTASGTGTATITGQLNGVSRNATITAVTTPVLSSLSGLSNRVVQSSTPSLTVSLDAAVAADTGVTLTTTNASVVAVPGSALVRAGSTSASVPVTLAGTGSATVTAQLGSSTQSVSTFVVSSAGVSFISMNSFIPVGGVSTLYVYVDAAVGTDTAVTMTSSNPSVISVPATVMVRSGSTSSAPVSVQPGAAGSALLTAQLGSTSTSLLVTAESTPAMVYFEAPSRLQTGATANMTIGFAVGSPTDTTVTLTSSDPTVLPVPASVVVPANTSYMYIPVTAGVPGSAFLTATAGSRTLHSNSSVVAVSMISSVFAGASKLLIGATVDVSVSMDAQVRDDTVLTITNSNATVLGAPAMVVIPAGSSNASFSISGQVVGTANLTLTASGSSRGIALSVVASPAVTFSISPTAKVATPSTLTVNLDAVTATDTTVTLTQTNAAALTMPGSVVVPAGRNSGAVLVTGQIAGAAITTVTATIGGSMQSTAITVLP